jgi:hypothetical protein
VFKRAVFRMRGLREWMSAIWDAPDGSTSPYNPRKLLAERDEGDSSSLPHPLEVELPGAKVTFAYDISRQGGRFEHAASFDAYAVVELENELALNAWREQWFRPLIDLLVFATREQVVIERFGAVISDHRRAEAVHPAIRPAASDDVWARRDIEVVRPHQVDVRERGIEPFQHMLLPLAALGNHAPAKLADFFTIHRALGATAAFFFVVLNTRTILQENRLLNLMAFAEGYHRTFHDAPPLPADLHRELRRQMLGAIPSQHRSVYSNPLQYANQQSQRKRVGALIARAAAAVPALSDPDNRFRDELVDTRNLYTHQGDPGEQVIAAEDLYERVERFIEVLEINLLVDIGLPPEEIVALHQNAHPSYD